MTQKLVLKAFNIVSSSPHEFVKASTLGNTEHIIPVIHLSKFGKELSSLQEIVGGRIRKAYEKWGLF